MSVGFRSEKVTEHIIRIEDGTDVCEYLITGEERALLIDTGYGIGDLRGYVESLSPLPLSVYITHGHVDHASGAGQFSDLHMDSADFALQQDH